MNPRAYIVIYGLWDGISGGRNNYYGRPRTMGSQFNELVKVISESDISRNTDIEFIDLLNDDPGYAYGMIKNMLDSGYKLPFVMINDKLAFCGTIPVWDIYNVTKYYVEYGYVYD